MSTSEAIKALKIAVSHIDHMAAWITKQNAGYSFESLGEDMPSIRNALLDAAEPMGEASAAAEPKQQALGENPDLPPPPNDAGLLPEPTEEMWSGLARDLMMAFDMRCHTPRKIFQHLDNCGTEIPAWLRDEAEMKALDHSVSKGTRCVLIYKAMQSMAPQPQACPDGWRLVPEKATEGMDQAVAHLISRAVEIGRYLRPMDVYQIMVANAPKPPVWGGVPRPEPQPVLVSAEELAEQVAAFACSTDAQFYAGVIPLLKSALDAAERRGQLTGTSQQRNIAWEQGYEQGEKDGAEKMRELAAKECEAYRDNYGLFPAMDKVAGRIRALHLPGRDQ